MDKREVEPLHVSIIIKKNISWRDEDIVEQQMVWDVRAQSVEIMRCLDLAEAASHVTLSWQAESLYSTVCVQYTALYTIPGS